MGRNTMILSPDEWVTTLVDRDRFEAEALKQWPDGQLVHPKDPTRRADVTLQVRRTGEPLFQIFHHRNKPVISTDADGQRAEEVGVWVASLLPEDPGGRVWYCDEGFDGHVELRRGMTLQELRDGWVDHKEHPPEFRDKDGNVHTLD